MSATRATCISKVWTTFSVKTKSGNLKKIRIIELPMERYEEFIDFTMKYYVKYEITHRVSGIPDSKEAMDEYREISNKIYKDTSVKKICYVDDDKIVGISAQKLFKIGDAHVDIKAQTGPVKKFYQILSAWNNLFPVPELMKKYNITSYYDDMGFAMHPLYTGLGFTYKMAPIRREICIHDNVPMTGAWLTAYATRKAVIHDGWEVVYEISYEELGRILGIKFENTYTTCAYLIARM